MKPNRLRELHANGRCAIAGWASIASPFAVELMGHGGCDAVVVDLQHGPFSMDAAVVMLHAASATPAVPLARVSGNQFAEIGKVLDAGAYGVICPLVDTAEQARAFVQAVRYPPCGARSFGPARGLLVGGRDYFDAAGDTVLALAMIETQAALDALDEILAIDGLDGVFVGPGDLSIALTGRPQVDWRADPLASALAKVREASRRAGRYAGIWCTDGAMASDMARAGWDLVAPGHDAGMLQAELGARVRQVRDAIG